jgi:hypothetical protein
MRLQGHSFEHFLLPKAFVNVLNVKLETHGGEMLQCVERGRK